MLPSDLLTELRAIVGTDRVQIDAPLAPYTTFHVGGPADCLVEVRNSEQLTAVARASARAWGPPTILGGGSNTVVADLGIRGVVVRAHGGEIREEPTPTVSAPSSGAVLVRADAGVSMNALVRWTIARGFAGLEAWAGTPGTVGGAIYGNAHYGGRNIADFVFGVRFLGVGGEMATDLPRDLLEFGYDRSRFQQTWEVILSAVFVLQRGADPAQLREVAHASLAHRKRTQPLAMPSAGCIFQNPDPACDRIPDGIPCSAGALVDRAGLKGYRIGGAMVSPTHANFIVSDGAAKASDIRALVRLCQAEVRRRFGINLREEIRWLGEFE